MNQKKGVTIDVIDNCALPKRELIQTRYKSIHGGPAAELMRRWGCLHTTFSYWKLEALV